MSKLEKLREMRIRMRMNEMNDQGKSLKFLSKVALKLLKFSENGFLALSKTILFPLGI